MKEQIKYIYKVFLLMSTVLNLSSCERRPLEEFSIPDGARIPVTIYWDQANIIPQNVTVLIYNEDGSLFLETVFENSGVSAYTEVYLPAGIYTVIGFNEMRNQIDYVRIRGHENLSTLEAYTTTASSTYSTQSQANQETIIDQPGSLAVAKDVITVSEEAVKLSHERALYHGQNTSGSTDLQVNLRPVLKTSMVHVKVYVSGLHNARMPALAELRNMASGYLLGTDRNSLTPVTTQFMLNNRAYVEGSATEGSVSASITSFGVPGNREIVENIPAKIYLDLAFQLVDQERTLTSFSRDVTLVLNITVDENRAVTINVDLSPEMIPPIILPDVKPEGGDDSGIGSDLIDWDTVVIPILL